ncbi:MULTISPECIES: Urease operon accessory protein [unclassified Ensifer]|uniref:Urease operon accessory protein n=1 Tax=unclassified Ensifer TaxID=2633371 RepID=UPI000812FCDD|nr:MULTISPECIES: Urease operon accessory protein [unclassified Ensifer]OCP02395.1 Urease operon accessory protein [Ensifer sp. LC14]OCP14119.1 Urease operon accessory protein [Ensifer sp. LC13]OCP14796.1 Urease operon accessory protein [Ensifer sp. LC11]OCP34282.1 Urease operon accessory protein [Ensifer sp. LC499]
MQGRRVIMIVGNGEVPDGAGATIDAADIVVRFNDCRSVGAGGQKTDIVAVCNTGRPGLAMLGGGRWKTNAAVRQAREIWCVRTGARFAAMRAGLAETHPDLDDFCDDYTVGFESFSRSTGRSFRIVPVAVHDQVDRDLAGYAPDRYVVPSSGMIVIADILAHLATPVDDVVLAGFGHVGWLWHPFAAERRYVDALAASGRLRRLHPFSSSSQGA